MVLAIWLPRGLALDRFVTHDEHIWLTRSGNFYYALAHGELARTLIHHPGTTVMWAGTGHLNAKTREIEPFLRASGYEPLELLTAGRVFMVLGITAALVSAFIAAVRLIGLLPASLGFLFIAFDPFHVALSRVLHPDGLMSSFLLLSLLTFLNYLYRGHRAFDLVVSAIAAGLSWLTKSPAFFLVPFVGLMMLVEIWRARQVRQRLAGEDFQRAVWPLISWAGVGLAVFVLLLPAMWVDPGGSLAFIFNKATRYATEGHWSTIYFNGKVVLGDPGSLFYPISYLWRTTPVNLAGLVLVIMMFTLPRLLFTKWEHRRTAAVLVLFVFLFTLFMSLGAKKFDRYLLPVYAPLDLLAAMGWVAGARWLQGRRFAWMARFGAPVMMGTAIVAQLLVMLPTFPYYFSYYNSLAGGSAKAPEVMMIGWGEGLDQAARYLNAKPNATEMRVASWYPFGPFSYFFKGETTHIGSTTIARRSLLSSNYLVLYIHQWQRKLPAPEFLAIFAPQEPEQIIRINGLEYAKIYKLPEQPVSSTPP
jgi:hypothetical protein